jgi:hypothetical protein
MLDITQFTATRQLIVPIPVTYSRTKVSDQGDNYFLMTRTKVEGLYIAQCAIASIEPVSFQARGQEESARFFLLTLLNGRAFYIDADTVTLLVEPSYR